ncbi:MAG: hypothetical protein ACXWC2_19320 [Ramlibacter sp.]
MKRFVSRTRIEQTILGTAFFLLFPGFFYYHTLLGIGASGAFLGGFFSPVSVLFALPIALIYLVRLRRDPRHLSFVDVYFGMYLAYFALVAALHAMLDGGLQTASKHFLEMLFLVNMYVMFNFIDFANPRFRLIGVAALAAMSAIVFAYSIDGVFYLGAEGLAKDSAADSLATYQGFARSYLVTYMAVIAYTRSLALRWLLHLSGAATLFINTARSEFVALLFVVPIIEFYYSRHKMVFVLLGMLALGVGSLYFDQVLAALPNSRILELLDLSQSTSAIKRHHLTENALQSIRAHPLMGDYGSYEPGYYSHNILSAWVDLGLFGLIYLSALLVLPVIPMFLREYFAGRRCASFMLGFGLAGVTVLLLLTSHYFTDMLIGATLGAYSKYLYERRYGQDRPSHLRTSASPYPHLRQAVPHLGGMRP